MKNYYTYYSYEEWGRGYIGKRSCDCLPEEDIEYFGSFKDATFKPTRKIILRSDYANAKELAEDEIILHDFYDVAKNPHFANQAKQTSTGFDRTGTKITEETRLKLSESRLGERNHMFGKTVVHTKETKEKMSESRLGEKNHMFGKKHTEQAIQEMIEAKVGEKNPFFGKNHSEESKQRMKEVKWYVNAAGETCRCREHPGVEWQPGRKWGG